MSSDIYIKTGSSTWSKMINAFVKTSSTVWSQAVAVWMFINADWVKVWPLSGIFSTRNPYIGTSSSTAYADRLTGSNVIRIGTSYVGNNAQWNANGWTITGYQYAWKYYSDLGVEQATLRSGTASGWTTTTGQDTLPTSIWNSTNSTNSDTYYLGFEATAKASNSAYDGTSVSTKIKIVREVPLNLTTTLSNYSTPSVGTAITYSSTWDTSEARKADSSRTTVYWYRNSTNLTSGGTYLASGTSYTPVSADIGNYLYVVETRYNSGTDYDYGSVTGVQATAITTATVGSVIAAPTSVNVYSMSRYNDTSVNAVISFSGGDGPYYQLYWTTANPAPTTASYDSASTGSPIADVFSPSSGSTYYFYVRSSTQNLGDTNTNGSAASGTYGPYSTAYASYTYSSPTGTVSVSPSTGAAGSTTFTATPSISAAPTADVSYQWQYLDQGSTYLNISGATSSTYTPPSNYFSLGYTASLRCKITANNGVGTHTANSNNVTVSLPAPSNTSAPTLTYNSLNVGGTLTFGVGSWSNSPTSYDLRLYRGTAGVLTSETLAKNAGNVTSSTYTITQADYDSGERYFRVYATASNAGGTSNGGTYTAGTEVGPITANVAPTISASSINPSSGTAGSTTFTASATVSGTPTPTLSYQWQYLSTSLSYVNISGATSSTYTPPANFNTLYPNYSFHCLITASNGISPNATSRPSATLNNPVSVPSGGSVSLNGTAQVGQTITAITSGWSGSPTSYDVRIVRGTQFVIISEQLKASSTTSSVSYTIQAADSGYYFKAFAYASNAGGTSSSYAQSNEIGPVTTAVSVPGTPTGVGLTGSGSVSWSAVSGATSYEIQFYTAQNGSGLNAAGPYTVTGISSSPYQLTSPYASPNNYARVQVRARNSAGASSYSGWVPSSTSYT